MKYKNTLLFIFALLLTSTTFAQTVERSVRIDPGYLYDDFPNTTLTPSQVAKVVIGKVRAAGVNTIYLYAYNSVYGAYYPTTYINTLVEADYGASNIFSLITQEAKLQSLKVIAVLPLNDFKKVWMKNISWRMKKKDTVTDYRPDPNVFLMSAYSDSYLAWYRGFINDFLARNPSVDGVEAVEAMVDYFWNKASDYNPDSNRKFAAQYPSAKLGDSTWLKFRAAGLTQLHGLFAETVHAKYKQAYAVQTWAPKSDGTLLSSSSIRDGSGFDFDGIMNLSGAQKLDGVTGEFMWQQWAADYSDVVFNLDWTVKVAQQFVQFTAGRTKPIIHIEKSAFAGNVGTYEPTSEQLNRQMQLLRGTGAGLDIYDYHQLDLTNEWSTVQSGW